MKILKYINIFSERKSLIIIYQRNQPIKLAITKLLMSYSNSFKDPTLTRTLTFLKIKKIWLLNLVIDKVISIIVFIHSKCILKFEFELKDKNKLNKYNILLQQSHFEKLRPLKPFLIW